MDRLNAYGRLSLGLGGADIGSIRRASSIGTKPTETSVSLRRMRISLQAGRNTMPRSAIRKLSAALLAVLMGALTLYPVAWACRNGRPCEFSCRHNLARHEIPPNAAGGTHACCPVTSARNAAGAWVAAGMECTARSVLRAAVVPASSSGEPAHVAAFPVIEELSSPERVVSPASANDAGPPVRRQALLPDLRAPPIPATL